MFKKFITLVTVFSLLLLANPAALAAQGEIFINGVKLAGAAPVLINGSTMVPMKVIFENIGATVKWDGANKTITANKDDKTVVLVVGNPAANINGVASPLGSAPVIINGKTYVPLRFSATAFGGTVKYDNATGNVQILLNNEGMAYRENEGAADTSAVNASQVAARDGMYPAAPKMSLDPAKKYTAKFSTSEGDFTVELLARQTPVTVNNFVFLANNGFYDGIVFHRIIKSFMIQAGDPRGDGTGGPGYRFKDELPPALPYAPGILAMANAGPGTNGSQFFICTGEDSLYLNQSPYYTVFGKVTEGMATVQKIAAVPVRMSGSGETSSPVSPVVIKKIIIDQQ